MTSFSDNIGPRVWMLSNKICEGTISEQEARELEALLKADRDALTFYVDFLKINSEIQWLVSVRPHSTLDSNARIPAPERSPILVFLSDWASFFSQHSVFSFMFLFIILCATLAGIAYLMHVGNAVQNPAEPMIAAQITCQQDCQWSEKDPAIAVDEPLYVGKQLRLDSGVVQVTYSNGATVLLQGPADYEIGSPNSGYLKIGKLTARCDTGQSRQFTIVTPNARFVDLGTEFGVMINDIGQAAIAVFAGRIKAEAKLAEGRWDTPVSLSAGESAICVERKFNPYVAQRNDFPALHPLPPPAPETPYGHWLEISQSLQKRPDLIAYYDFERDPGNPRLLVNRAPTGAAFNGEIRNASWAGGRFEGKNALKFAAADSGVLVNLPGQYEQLTLIAWVKINELHNYWNGLFMTNDFSLPGQLHLEIRSDTHITMYVVQKNRSRESFFSAEPIPDDCLYRWCMIAAVIDRTNQGCSMYVNDMCILDQKRISQIPPIIIGPATIAGRLDKGNDRDKTVPIRNLACCMDSFLIFNSALTQDEIRRIYESGKGGDQ